MAYFDFTSDEEEQLWREIQEENDRVQQATRSTSPWLAQNLQNFYRNFPSAPRDALVPAVQAFTNGQMDEAGLTKFLEDLSTKQAQTELARQDLIKKNKKKSWFERNVMQKVRTGSRWTMASLNLFPQVVTNVASAGYRFGQELGEGDFSGAVGELSPRGFIISTDLGTLIENDEVAGDGFFLGGRAAQLQAERAREYRGTIDGQAFTLGRGVSRVFFEPGSKEYRLLSGLVDAAAAIAVPSVPGGRIVTAGLQALGKSTAAKAGIMTLAGLSNFGTTSINFRKVGEFLDSRAGQTLIQKLVDIDSIDEAIEAVKGADLTWYKAVVDAKDTATMRSLLDDTLGLPNPIKGSAPRSYESFNLSKFDTWKRDLVQRESTIARLMSSMPGRAVVIKGGSDREKLESIKNVKNYLRLLKVPEANRKQILEAFADGLIKDDGSLNNVTELIAQTTEQAFKTMGVEDDLIRDIMGKFKETKEFMDSSLFGEVGDAGASWDSGGKFFVDAANSPMAYQPLNTAGSQGEMLKHAFMLPDPRETRRLMSDIGWITGKTGKFDPMVRGQLRLPLSIIEAAQNIIWKPFVLMTGGYVLRNMTDSLLRQTFRPDLDAGLTHPLELILLATHKKMGADILGENFPKNPEEFVKGTQRELQEAVNVSLRELDPVTRTSREYKTGVWGLVKKDLSTPKQKQDFVEGVAAEVGLLHQDTVARLVAEGRTTDEIVESLIADPKKEYLVMLNSMWGNRNLRMVDGSTQVGSIKFVDRDLETITPQMRHNIQTFVEEYMRPRVRRTTGDSQVLKDIVARGAFVDDKGADVYVFKYEENGRDIRSYFHDDYYKAISKVVDDPTVTLKEFYKRQIVIDNFQRASTDELQNVINAMNRMTDKFFGSLYTKREAFLNRSPVFRQFYYRTVGEFADDLAPQEIDKLFRTIADRVGATDNKLSVRAVANYVGDRKLAENLIAKFEGRAASTGGKLTLREVDAYAKGYALDETKKLFYNAAEKSNFADILRIVAPFGTAWAEVLKSWSKLLTSDPEVLKRIGVTVQGLQEADPDGDGKGFFYKDPQTGELMFNFPYSDAFIPLITTVGGAVFGGLPGAAIGLGGGLGVNALAQEQLGGLSEVFTMPVKSLSMGLNVYPPIGPYVQMAATWALKDKPEADFVLKAIAPYGAPAVGTGSLPTYARLILSAITADPDSDKRFADLKADTLKALSATGDYDLSTQAGIDQLDKDATTKARWLSVIQGIGYFVGPTRPQIDFKIATAQGDIQANELSKAWYDLRAENFDTAVEKFLNTFGDDVFMYMQGKTRAEAGGLELTSEFGDWERRNSSIFDRYPEVAGYFAPVGTNFSYQVYSRQIETGQRERLSGKEMIAEAQARVGIALYRDLVRSIGGKPNEQQQEIMRAYRERLGRRFPGFANRPIDINQTRTTISRLYEAVQDPGLADNPIAEAARAYLMERDKAIAAINGMGYVDLSNKRAADLRSYLRDVGETLVLSYPEFERLWDRILYQEVDVLV